MGWKATDRNCSKAKFHNTGCPGIFQSTNPTFETQIKLHKEIVQN